MARRAWLEYLRREAFNTPYTTLIILGWWVFNSESKWKNVLYDIYSFLNIGLFLLVFLDHMIDIYFLVQEEKYKEIPASLYGSLLTYFVVTKTLLCRIKWRTIAELRRNLTNNLGVKYYGESPEEAAIVKKSVDEMVGFILFFGSSTFAVLVFWIARPFFHSKRALPFTLRLPMDKLKSPIYECVFTYQMWFMFSCCFTIQSTDQIMIGLIIRISAHCEVLTKKILKLGRRSLNNEITDEYRSYNEIERARLKQEIKKCVQHHQVILKYEAAIFEFLQGPLMFHFVGLSLMVCVTVLDIVEAKQITWQAIHSFIYAGCVLFDTFIYCYYGTRLATKNNDLFEAIYDAPWLEADSFTRRAFILMNTIAFRAPRLNAILFRVDLPLFLSVIQVSYNMVAVLHSTGE